MTLDLRTEFRGIGWLEPSLYISVLVGIALAVAFWFALAWLAGRIVRPWRRRILLPSLWACAFLVLILAPHILLQLLFSLRHPNVWACAVTVGWVLYIPALTLAILAVCGRKKRLGGARNGQGQLP